MKLVVAIIKPFKLQEVREALVDAGISRADLLAARNLNAAGARLNSLKKRRLLLRN